MTVTDVAEGEGEGVEISGGMRSKAEKNFATDSYVKPHLHGVLAGKVGQGIIQCHCDAKY